MSTIESKVASSIAAYIKANHVKATEEEGLSSAAEPALSEATVAEMKELVLKSGEQAFSAVFGVTPANGDFAIPKFDAVPEAAKVFVPALDKDYVPQTEEVARLVSAFVDGDKTLITGPTGSGKSSCVKYVCAKLGLPFIRINMSGDVESSSIFGTVGVKEGATVWQDGALTEAVQWGAVCLIDEWELMPPEITMGIQNLLEDDGYLYLKEKPGTSEDRHIVPHNNFRLVCAGNTVGQGDDTGSFAGTMVQNTATIDRFTTTIKLDYLATKHETTLIRNKTGVKAAVATKMVKVAELIRNAHGKSQLNLTMSPRTLINWGKKMSRYSPRMAFTIAYMDKCRDSDRPAVEELYTKVFGTE